MKYTQKASQPSFCASSATGLLTSLTDKVHRKSLSHSQDSFTWCHLWFHRYKWNQSPAKWPSCHNIFVRLINVVYPLILLFKTQLEKCTHQKEPKNQTGLLVGPFPRSLWSHTSSSLQPHGSSRTHKTFITSLRLSNKYPAVWIIEIIQNGQMIFCSKPTWHAAQETIKANKNDRSWILFAKLIDGCTKMKHATAYAKLSKTHCITVTKRLPLHARCNMIVIAVKGRETDYMLNPAICRCFTQFHLLLPGQKFTVFSLVRNQSRQSLLHIIFDPLSKQFLYYIVIWLHWRKTYPHILLRIHFLLVSLIIIISIFSKRTVEILFFPVNSPGAQQPCWILPVRSSSSSGRAQLEPHAERGWKELTVPAAWKGGEQSLRVPWEGEEKLRRHFN